MQIRVSGTPRSRTLPSPDLGPAPPVPVPPPSLYRCLTLSLCSASFLWLCPLPCPGPRSSQLPVAGPSPSAAGRHPGVRPAWAWLLGGCGDQQMFAIRRGPRRPRPLPAWFSSPPTLGAERARQENPQIRPGCLGRCTLEISLWSFSENSHLWILPACFLLPSPGSWWGQGSLGPRPPGSSQNAVR